MYRFEDLRLWQAARDLSVLVGELRKRPEFQNDRDLTAQLNDASLSVMSNVAEGFLRHRDREFLQFLRVAAGSNGEVRSLLIAAQGRAHLSAAEADDLIERTNAIGRMIRRLQATLKP